MELREKNIDYCDTVSNTNYEDCLVKMHDVHPYKVSSTLAEYIRQYLLQVED